MSLFWEDNARCYLALTTLITRELEKTNTSELVVTGDHVLTHQTGLFPRVVTECVLFVFLCASHVAECAFNHVTEDSL